jgi:hypothetical protein
MGGMRKKKESMGKSSGEPVTKLKMKSFLLNGEAA